MEKVYNNSRGVFASFIKKTGYLYLSSAARKAIQDMSDKQYIDVYLDKDNERIVIEVNDSGEFALGKSSV